MPLPVISVEQMRAWEAATWAAGIPERSVIERVGAAVAQRALRLTEPNDPILLLAGKGHNGDDVRACRPHLKDRRVDSLEIEDPTANLGLLDDFLRYRNGLIIDGLFGIGLNRQLEAGWISVIEKINRFRGGILSVDVPSGLDAQTGKVMGAAVKATVTLTVGTVKAGLLQESAWEHAGQLEVADNVGLVPCTQTSELQWSVPEDFAGYPPHRAVQSHKGSYGHLAIIAGSLGYHGAAVLAARGAQRAQPGLITLHTMEAVYQTVASQLQAVMVNLMPAEPKLPGSWSAFLLGPGLAAPGLPDHIKMFARLLWRDAVQPVLIDASAIDWLPLKTDLRTPLRVVTPHPGEAARLLRSTTQAIQANRLEALRSISNQVGNAWVVLKGHHTLIGRGEGPVFVNPTGNPHLAQGGSGDVLSGFLAGLLAQPDLQKDLSMALRYGVWQHGSAADHLQAERANWIIEDLAAELGAAPPRARP